MLKRIPLIWRSLIYSIGVTIGMAFAILGLKWVTQYGGQFTLLVIAILLWVSYLWLAFYNIIQNK